MKKKIYLTHRQQNPLLSKSLTENAISPNSLETLEAEGRWEELKTELAQCPQLSLTEQLLYLKAQILSEGPSIQIDTQLSNIESKISINVSWQDQLRFHLIKAFLFRRERKMKDSQLHVDRALEIGLKLDNTEPEHPLVHEAFFQQALMFGEQDDFFRALDLYKSLRKRPLTSYRLGLCALNECVLLWDLGLFQKMEEHLSLVPEKFRIRMKLGLHLAHGRWEQVADFCRLLCQPKGIGLRRVFMSLPPGERESILLELTEWSYLANRHDVRDHFKSHFVDEIQSSPVLAEILNETRVACFSEADDADLRILKFLKSGSRDLSLYKRQIESFLIEKELFGPLLPRVKEIETQATPYSQLWFQYFNPQKLDEVHIFLRNNFLVEVHQAEKVIFLDFKNQSLCYRLLQLLCGAKDTPFNRRTLHEGLTGSKYVPGLHDPRLHKLLQRTAKKIEGTLPYAPWVQLGDRLVRLRVHIHHPSEEKAAQ